MKSFLRIPLTVLALASLTLLAAGCKPADKAADKPAASAEAKGDTAVTIAGLPTEKDQVSYMIGMDLGKSFEPFKDEIDVDRVAKTIKAMMAGEKPLMDEKQAAAVREAFGQKMQAKQIAKMMAEAKKNLAEGEAFLAANAKKPGVQTTPSGLQYQVVTEGKGPKPQPTDVVRVNYKGTLLDGKTFDSSYDRGEPATFSLNQVVPGWQEGIAMMPVGSKYKFWIPAKLGYGDKGTPGGPIPPNATLVFEVELLDIVKQPAK
jgi:FKBP-type peptidyl-prolyl cis-trans isomerase FkpA/FKBP-type peptidyl-prolyl cis-trans isomerase FklB